MKSPSQKCEIFIVGQHSCSAELSEASTSNVAEVLYKNGHKIMYSHLFFNCWCNSSYSPLSMLVAICKMSIRKCGTVYE